MSNLKKFYADFGLLSFLLVLMIVPLASFGVVRYGGSSSSGVLSEESKRVEDVRDSHSVKEASESTITGGVSDIR